EGLLSCRIDDVVRRRHDVLDRPHHRRVVQRPMKRNDPFHAFLFLLGVIVASVGLVVRPTDGAPTACWTDCEGWAAVHVALPDAERNRPRGGGYRSGVTL